MRTIADEGVCMIRNFISSTIHETSTNFHISKEAILHGMHKPYECDFAENRKKLEEKENGSL